MRSSWFTVMIWTCHVFKRHLVECRQTLFGERQYWVKVSREDHFSVSINLQKPVTIFPGKWNKLNWVIKVYTLRSKWKIFSREFCNATFWAENIVEIFKILWRDYPNSSKSFPPIYKRNSQWKIHFPCFATNLVRHHPTISAESFAIHTQDFMTYQPARDSRNGKSYQIPNLS